jgi:hypothetical protein
VAVVAAILAVGLGFDLIAHCNHSSKGANQTRLSSTVLITIVITIIIIINNKGSNFRRSDAQVSGKLQEYLSSRCAKKSNVDRSWPNRTIS